MTTEEAKRLVDEAFENSPVIKEWRELAKRERVEQARLLRRAVESTVLQEKYDDPKYVVDSAWQAYYDSL